VDTLKNVIKKILKEKKIDKIEETEKEIEEEISKNFLQKHIKEIYFYKEQIIIETNSVEAKTEINLIKTRLKHKEKIRIK
jgi:hypothetical protein